MSEVTHSQVAKRYAEALFTSLDAADHRLMSQEFETVITVLEDPVIQGVFRHPQTTKERKRALIGKMQLSPTLEKFLLLIVEKSREAAPSWNTTSGNGAGNRGVTICLTAISYPRNSTNFNRVETLQARLAYSDQGRPTNQQRMIIKVDGKVWTAALATLKSFSVLYIHSFVIHSLVKQGRCKGTGTL